MTVVSTLHSDVMSPCEVVSEHAESRASCLCLHLANSFNQMIQYNPYGDVGGWQWCN